MSGAAAAASTAANPLVMLSDGQAPLPWPARITPLASEEMATAVDAIDAIDMLTADNMDNELVAAGAVQGQNRDLINSLVTFLIGTIAFQFQRTIDDSEHQLGIILLFFFLYQISARLESLLRTLLSRPSFGRPTLADYLMFPTRQAAAFVGFVAMGVLRSNIMPSDGGFRLIDVVPVAIFLLLVLAEIMFEQFHLTVVQTLYKQAATILAPADATSGHR